MKKLIWLVFIAIMSSSIAQNYRKDLTFISGSGFNDVVYSTAIQNDGKIIVGGAFTSYNGTPVNRIARININGTLDLSFNTGSGFNRDVYTIVIQTDGKILVGGDFTLYNNDGARKIARLNNDGILDLSFQTGNGFESGGGFSNYADVRSISLQLDGGIIVGGYFNLYDGTPLNNMTRLNSDGSIDLTFNTSFNEVVETVSIQTDGKILVGGYFSICNGLTAQKIVRLNSDGTTDLTFNTGNGYNGVVETTVIQTDGKIIMGGGFTSYNGTPVNRIARININGTLDLSFNTGLGFNSEVYSTAIQTDGKIIIGGSFTNFNNSNENNIVRLNSNGVKDPSFNTNLGFNNIILAISLQSDGKIVAGGLFSSFNGVETNRITRLRYCTNTPINQSINQGSCGDYTSSTGQVYTESGIYTEYIPNILGCDSIERTINLTIYNNSYLEDIVQIQQPSCLVFGDGSITVYPNISTEPSMQSSIIISEYFLDIGDEKWVEIYNTSSNAINLSDTIFIDYPGFFNNLHRIVLTNGNENYFFPLNTVVPPCSVIRITNPLSTNPSTYMSDILDGNNLQIRLLNINPPDSPFSGASWVIDEVQPANGNTIIRQPNISIPNDTFNIVEWSVLPISSSTPGIHQNNDCIGGNFDYSVVWSNGQVTNTLNNISSGTYSYQIVYSPCGNLVDSNTIIVTNSTLMNTQSATICNGDTYTWNGQQYTQAGQYTQTFTNQFGCDSVVSLTLNVNANDNISITPNPAFGNAPLNVAFANQTANLSNYNFTWYFGDGTSQQSNAPFLSHIYTQDGYADVTVVAENLTTGCSSSQTFNDMIFVIGGVTCTHSATLNQTGPLSGCSGDSLLLSCNTDPSFTYQWNRNGVPVSGATSNSFYPTQSGSYTVTIYQNNCPVTSAGISVTINPLPSLPTITSSGTITPCSGGSMTLTAPSGFSSYLWNTGSTASSLVVSQSGNYSVTVTNNNGCSRTSNPFAVNASFMAAPQVCIVGVDSLTNENRVVWEKPLTQGIDSFYVYKETNVSNVYTKIGATDYNDLAVFLDVNSNPAVQAYRYKISALDTCGVETNVGDFHKTIHLTINQGIGGAWNLIWSHYEGLNFGSYNIYRGTDPSNISLLTTIQSNLNSYSDLTPPTGPLYYQIEVVNPVNCDPTKVLNYGVSRSNIVNNGVSGVKEIVNTNILVYPNPTNSNITLQVSAELVGRRYLIQDFSGRIILNGKISTNQEQINLQDVARGAYYLSIENSSSVTKVIKQ